MKILTTNFLTCAVKSCRSSPTSFPLHPQNATLSRRDDLPFQPQFILNLLPRLHYDALSTIAASLSLTALLPEQSTVEGIVDKVNGGEEVLAGEEGEEEDGAPGEVAQVLKALHGLLLETEIVEGELVCGNCGFVYPVKEGVGNFLLPSHLV